MKTSLIFNLILLITTLFPCFAQKHGSKDSVFMIIIPGNMHVDPHGTVISRELNAKYYVDYFVVGNVSTDSLVKIEKHNHKVDSILNLLNGSDWQEKLEGEYKVAYSRDSLLVSVVKKEAQKHIPIETLNGYLIYRDSTLSTDTYRVNIFDRSNSYMRVLIKYPELNIISIDREVIKRRRKE